MPRRLSTGAIVAISLVSLAFLALFYRWIWKQHEFSANAMQDWGHAYAIPLISLAMIWVNRARILATPVTTFWPGLAPFLLGIVCYVFFIVGVSNHMLQGAALLLTLSGLVILTLGPKLFRHLFLPIAFLVFAVTVSEQVMNKITFQLQLIASQGSFVMLSVLGGMLDFAVTVQGNMLEVIHNGKITPLNVAEACSGMRMVIAFFALAAAVAIFGCRLWWQRVALITLAAPVAVFLNMVRVTVLGVLTLIDPNLAAGDIHMLIGMLLLVPGLFLFMGMVWAMEKAVAEPKVVKT
jgi:exosortase